MAKVLIRTMRLSAIARLMGPGRTAVVVLLALTVALTMVAMALTTSAGAMPPNPDLIRDLEGGGGGSLPPPPYKPPANGFSWVMEPRYGTDRDSDGVTDSHWNEATASYDKEYINPEVDFDGPGPEEPAGFNVFFNGCPNKDEFDASKPSSEIGPHTQNQYTWDFGDGSPAGTAANCRPSHHYKEQGSYEVKLTYSTQTYTQTIEVRDVLIAALGDSYGSGEGAPDVPLRTREGFGDPTMLQIPILYGIWKLGDAKWVDQRCHRSAYVGSAQVARRLEYSDPHTSVTYVSFACSGANISRETFEGDDSDKPNDKPNGSGLLGPYRGIEPPDSVGYDQTKFLPPQVDALARTLAGCAPREFSCALKPHGEPSVPPSTLQRPGRPIDALIISAGGNDVGFADILAKCTTGLVDCFDDPKVTDKLSTQLAELMPMNEQEQEEVQRPGRYEELVKAIHAPFPAERPPLEFSQRTPDVADVYVTEYPDGMRDDDGNNCDSMLGDITGPALPGKINKEEVKWLREYFHAQLVKRMQAAVEGANNNPDLRPLGNDSPKWKYVEGIADRFGHHGYCADDRYVNTGEDARFLQGPAHPHWPMSLHAINVLLNPWIYVGEVLAGYFTELADGRAKTAGKAHPNVRGYLAYADSLHSDLNPLIGLPAGDPLPKLQSVLTTADETSTQGTNGWLTGSDASPSRAVLGVRVDDPSGVSAGAATINASTVCPTNTAGAAECSVVDVSTQRKEWHFRFHEDGIYRLEFTAQGNDGQTAFYTHDAWVDLHDPEAFADPSRPPDANGWYTAPVDVMLRGEDPVGGSGVQMMEYTLNDGPVQELVPGEKVTVDAKGTTNLRYQAVDGAGRRSQMQELSINIDSTPPVIELPANITEYATSQDGAQVDYSATATDYVDGDVVVGDIPVDCSPASGSTFPIGATQVTCSATDTAGNEATKTFNVSVHYDFGNGSGGGFTEPVTNGVLNQLKAGAAVPVKFGLGGNMGLDIFATGYPTSRKISCDTQAVTDPIEETVAVTNSGLKYDATAGQYHYNLKTEKAWANTCRELVVKLKDGTEHPINFKFK